MYEDALFMSNLFGYLHIPTGGEAPACPPAAQPTPRAGRRRSSSANVSFRYPGKTGWALRDLSLTLAPGEKLGLVGENGAGKSTLVKLLMRLYDPTEGEIRYGGVDLRDMDPADLRRADRRRVPGLRAIPVHGRGEHRPRQPRASSRIAPASPRRRGVAAPRRSSRRCRRATTPSSGAGSRLGTSISSGQWQKLAVARAFMREDAEVLVLDEPTAAIDAEAEHELFQHFRQLAADRTAIVISHRFSTVRIADRIAVLHGGRLEELGTHRELVARGGRYAQLFRLQAQGYLD